MKFNLKKYANKGDKTNSLIENQLRRDDQSPQNSVTEDQLKKDRVSEKNETTEAQLDQKRTGGADSIIEKKLNDSKGGFHKHRNSEASKGDFNKLEEQRVSKKKQEDEKAKTASSTPKNKKWWESLKAEASKSQRNVTAGKWYDDYDDEDDDYKEEEPEELSFGEDRWNRVNEGDWGDEASDDFDVDVSGGDDFEIPDDLDFEDDLSVGNSAFRVESLQPTDVEGIMLGKVTVDPRQTQIVMDMDDETIRQVVKDLIQEKHDNIYVDSDGVDLSKLVDGEINFVAQREVQKGGPKTESWENIKGDPIASNDFDIVVLSDTKKK